MTSRFDDCDLSDLRTDPSFQRFLLQIAAEWWALLEHSLAHGHVAPDDLQIVYDLIRNEENMIDDIVHFLGGKVTVALFEHTELPEWWADLRQTLTLVAPGSRATHCAPSRWQ